MNRHSFSTRDLPANRPDTLASRRTERNRREKEADVPRKGEVTESEFIGL